MSVKVRKILSEKGRTILIVKNFKFSFHKDLAGGVKRWKCTQKGCRAFLKTNENEETFETNLSHNHSCSSSEELLRQELRNSIKRKTAEGLCIRSRPTYKSKWNTLHGDYRKSFKKRIVRGQGSTKLRRYKYCEHLTFLNKYFPDRESKAPMVNMETVVEKKEDDEQMYDFQLKEEETENSQHPLTVVDNPLIVGYNQDSQDENKSLQERQISTELPPEPSQETVIPTLLKYIINNNETKSTALPSTHPVDAFLAGIAPTLKNLSPYYLNLAKSKIFSAVQEYEIVMLSQQGQTPPINASVSKIEPTTILLEAKSLACAPFGDNSYSSTSSPIYSSPESSNNCSSMQECLSHSSINGQQNPLEYLQILRSN